MEIGDRQPDIAVDPVWRGEHGAHPDCRDLRCRSRLDEPPADDLAAPPTERKAYAVDPPGRPPDPDDPVPPEAAEPQRVPVWIPVPSLGHLLDVLA